MVDLIKGVLYIIFFSIAIGRYDDLSKFARKEGIRALSGRGLVTPRFFPRGYEIELPHQTLKP